MALHVYQGPTLATKSGLAARVTLPFPTHAGVRAGDTLVLLDPVSGEHGCYGFAQVMLCELGSGLRCATQPLYLSRRDLEHCVTLPEGAWEWLTIGSEELAIFGGVAGLVDYLCHRSLSALFADRIGGVREPAGNYQTRVRDAIGQLYRRSLATPALTGAPGPGVQDDAFRVAVKGEYRFRCCVCGVCRISPTGCFEVEAVRIFPKARQGSDDLRNGLALCRTHAWAFEHGLFGLDDNGRVIVHPELPAEAAYTPIRQYAQQPVELPNDERYQPHPVFLEGHRRLHGLRRHE